MAIKIPALHHYGDEDVADFRKAVGCATYYIKDPVTGRISYAESAIDVIKKRPISKPGRKNTKPGD